MLSTTETESCYHNLNDMDFATPCPVKLRAFLTLYLCDCALATIFYLWKFVIWQNCYSVKTEMLKEGLTFLKLNDQVLYWNI